MAATNVVVSALRRPRKLSSARGSLSYSAFLRGLGWTSVHPPWRAFPSRVPRMPPLGNGPGQGTPHANGSPLCTVRPGQVGRSKDRSGWRRRPSGFPGGVWRSPDRDSDPGPPERIGQRGGGEPAAMGVPTLVAGVVFGEDARAEGKRAQSEKSSQTIRHQEHPDPVGKDSTRP